MSNKVLIIVIFIAALFHVSCDFVLKDSVKQNREQPHVITQGSDEIIGQVDTNGCAKSAGYYYSQIQEECVRPFEVGIRLNPLIIDANLDQIEEENDIEQNGLSCFVLIGKNKKHAEIFLPRQDTSLVLQYNPKQQIYVYQAWKLSLNDDILLSYNDQVKFSAAKAVELNISSDLKDDI